MRREWNEKKRLMKKWLQNISNWLSRVQFIGILPERLCHVWIITETFYQCRPSIDRLWMICTMRQCRIKWVLKSIYWLFKTRSLIIVNSSSCCSSLDLDKNLAHNFFLCTTRKIFQIGTFFLHQSQLTNIIVCCNIQGVS